MNPDMSSSISDARNAMAQALNTSSLQGQKGKSSILENYSMKEAWKFADNAIQGG